MDLDLFPLFVLTLLGCKLEVDALPSLSVDLIQSDAKHTTSPLKAGIFGTYSSEFSGYELLSSGEDAKFRHLRQVPQLMTTMIGLETRAGEAANLAELRDRIGGGVYLLESFHS